MRKDSYTEKEIALLKGIPHIKGAVKAVKQLFPNRTFHSLYWKRHQLQFEQKPKFWTEAEEKIIEKLLYEKKIKVKLAGKLPDRTMYAIRSKIKATRLKSAKSKRTSINAVNEAPPHR